MEYIHLVQSLLRIREKFWIRFEDVFDIRVDLLFEEDGVEALNEGVVVVVDDVNGRGI